MSTSLFRSAYHSCDEGQRLQIVEIDQVLPGQVARKHNLSGGVGALVSMKMMRTMNNLIGLIWGEMLASYIILVLVSRDSCLGHFQFRKEYDSRHSGELAKLVPILQMRLVRKH